MKNSNWENLESKLQQPIQAPQGFGRLMWWRDESAHSLVSAIGLSALLLILTLLTQLAATPNDQGKPGNPEVKVELYQKWNPHAVGTDSSEIADTVQETRIATQIAKPVAAIEQLDQTQPTGNVPAPIVRPATDLNALNNVKRNTAEIGTALQQLEDQRRQSGPQPGGRPQVQGFNGLAGLFDVPPDVKSIVYVVDKSSSMAGPPLEAVKAELIHGIESLKDGQKFGVIFFDDFAWPQFSLQGEVVTAQASSKFNLVGATATTRRRANDWISRMFGDGSTNPVPAMSLAIAEKPELIVLLSDGEFAPSAVYMITDMNRRVRGAKSRIDCIGLADGIETLRDIAVQNNGKYFVRAP